MFACELSIVFFLQRNLMEQGKAKVPRGNVGTAEMQSLTSKRSEGLNLLKATVFCDQSIFFVFVLFNISSFREIGTGDVDVF